MVKGAGLIGSDPDSAAVFRAGAAGSIAFGDQADFPNRHAFTLEAWIQPAKASRKRVGGPVISKLQKHWGGYALETTGRGRLSFSLSRGKRPATVYGPRLAAGERHHVVASFDGRTMRICVDGSCGSGWARSASRRLVDNAAPLLVGRQGRGAFAGTIDEVAVYGLALRLRRSPHTRPRAPDFDDKPLGMPLVHPLSRWPTMAGERPRVDSTKRMRERTNG